MAINTKVTKPLVSRAIRIVQNAQATQDGAGVSLYRAIGNPSLREIDPFLLLDEMHSDKPDDYIAGFPPHPHRGFETLTYMVSGKMRHRDSRDNEGVVGSGGVQWMNAGRGIVHSEIPEQDEGLLWGYQLWVNLPAARKMAEPDYRDIPAEDVPGVPLKDGGFIRVIAGDGIAERPGPVVRDDIGLVFLDISLPPHTRLTQALPEGHTVFVYIAKGEAEFGRHSNNSPVRLRKRSIAVFDDGDQVSAATGDSMARFLLVAGRPIEEPIVRHGPFVMNSRAEILEAINDYKAGVLG